MFSLLSNYTCTEMCVGSLTTHWCLKITHRFSLLLSLPSLLSLILIFLLKLLHDRIASRYTFPLCCFTDKACATASNDFSSCVVRMTSFHIPLSYMTRDVFYCVIFVVPATFTWILSFSITC